MRNPWARHLHEWLGFPISTLMTTLVLTGCLASPSASLSEAQVESLLGQLRDGLGDSVPWQAKARVRMPGADGRGRFLAGDDGRFRLEVDTPIRYAEAHDGAVTSKLYPWGRVLDLKAREEEMTLIPMWVITGYWLSQEAPLAISAGPTPRQGDIVSLEVQHRDGELPFEVHVDTKKGTPIRIQPAQGTAITAFELAHRTIGGRPILEHLRILKGKNVMVELELDQPVALAPEGQPWVRPTTATQASYDANVSPQLEVHNDGNGYLFVKPIINGQQLGWFLFDTGAPATLLGNSAVRKLGLHELAEARSSGVGGQAQIGLHAVDSIQVGPVRLGPLYMASMDVQRLGWQQLPIEGILGCEVFSEAVIEYNVRSSSITFHDPNSYQLPVNASWQDLQLHEGKPIARLRFEDHEADFLVDTGAGGAFSVSKPLIDRLGLLDGRRTQPSRSRGVGGSVDMQRGEVRWLEFGGRRYRNVRTMFAVSDQGSYGQPFPDGLIGIQLIDDYRWVLDLSHRRMAFLPLR